MLGIRSRYIYAIKTKVSLLYLAAVLLRQCTMYVFSLCYLRLGILFPISAFVFGNQSTRWVQRPSHSTSGGCCSASYLLQLFPQTFSHKEPERRKRDRGVLQPGHSPCSTSRRASRPSASFWRRTHQHTTTNGRTIDICSDIYLGRPAAHSRGIPRWWSVVLRPGIPHPTPWLW